MTKPAVLFLDLDETLYPHSSGLWERIGERIQRYIERALHMPPEEAERLRVRYLQTYGTTLQGLREEYQVNPIDYMSFIHDVPVESLLKPDAELKKMLSRITVPRIIFTNAPASHALRVVKSLDIEDEIDDIIDILRLDYANKPRSEAYARALRLAGDPDPHECVFVDDRIDNLQPAAALGMRTILVGQGNLPPDAQIVHIPDITKLLEFVPELANTSDPSGG